MPGLFGALPGILLPFTNRAGRAGQSWLAALLPLLLAFGLLLLLVAGPAQAQTTNDYDSDDDRLIEISTMAQLHAIRHDLTGAGTSTNAVYTAAFPSPASGQCPTSCQGYELEANLTFDSDGDGDVDSNDHSGAYWNSGAGWSPIGADSSNSARYQTRFKGNGHTIDRLFINRSAGDDQGLFGAIHSNAQVELVGVTNANVTARDWVGILVGSSYGVVYASYSTGQASGRNDVGGLVGFSDGPIRASYSTAAVQGSGSGNTNNLGGLVGWVDGDPIVASYATGSVTASSSMNAGGLAGSMDGSGAVITASYAIGAVSGSGSTGGLMGRIWRSGSASNSYYNSDTSGQTDTGRGAGQTTTQLQQETAYGSGIYANWNVNVDGVAGNDDPWDFGTASQYPALKVDFDGDGTATAYEFGGQGRGVDYDTDNDGLIEIDTAARLNVLRHDLNGDGRRGTVSNANWTTYTNAFATPLATQCDDPATTSATETCAGYELTGDLTLSGSWTPIGTYAATLDGNGYAISGMSISHSATSSAGLISRLAATGVIRNLGVINATVAVTSTNANGHGILVGFIPAGAVVSASYVSGGSLTVAASGTRAGPLVGHSRGTITASYATATVAFSGNPASGNLGGLVGHLEGGSITASYATGAITEGSGATVYHGGLTGRASPISTTNPTIANSYCSAASGETDCIGLQSGPTLTATRYTAAQLQAPTDYAGIYGLWNVDLDADTFVDFPWNFGSSSEYPTLRTPDQRATSPTTLAVGDYDADDDGLIEIRSLTQLEALTHDLDGNGNASAAGYGTAFPSRLNTNSNRMGCPSGTCTGYELMTDITFPGGSYFWTPLGSYTATLEGNGHTLTDLAVAIASTYNTGLFQSLGATAAVRNLGLVNAVVAHTHASQALNHGALAGFAAAGASINAVYVQGGTISAFAAGSNVGGLIGLSRGTIRASWSTAAVAVSGNPTGVDLGGLVGHLEGGAIIASYAAGAITEGTGAGVNHGGLAGRATDFTTPNPDVSPIVTNSYCDSTVESSGSGIVGIDCHSTTALQTPTDYSGIYLNWNIDLGTDGDLDYPWDFGANNEYPTLHTPAERAELVPAATDYDADDDGLIEISTAAQLNAVRWDLDANGAVLASNYSAYGTAFGGRTHTATADTGVMGCPLADGCTGYELLNNLTLTGNWTPLGGTLTPYTATFDGDGHTISGLTVSVSSGQAGLFGRLTGTVRNVGLLNPSVTSAAASQTAGGLVGLAGVGANIETSYVSGGSVTVSGASAEAGGLVGQSQATIRASYATAAVGHSGDPGSISLGGLAGTNWGVEIIASYAAGAVTVGSGSGAVGGGLVGTSDGSAAATTNSYCDSSVMLVSACIGAHANSSTATAAAHPTADLQTPMDYSGIYANWNIDLDGVTGGDNPWDFGTNSDYPAVRIPSARVIVVPPPDPVQPDPVQPGNGGSGNGGGNGGSGNGQTGGGQAQPVARGGGQPYHPASAHPEIYTNPRHEMAVSCALRTTGTGDQAQTTSTMTFDLGTYTRPITLVLSLWDGQFFRTLQSQGIAMPELRQDGQTATVEVVTDPTQTRFRIDSEYGLNLVLGYADCRTDDPEE